MIAKYIFIPLSVLLAGCSSYTELSYNCTGYLKERQTILGKTFTESNPKVIGVYITESTKTPFNFWKDKTRMASVGDMLFTNHESSITEFAIMGRVDDKKDSVGHEVSQNFLLDRKTNTLTTNKKMTRANYEKVDRFEGACNSVNQ